MSASPACRWIHASFAAESPPNVRSGATRVAASTSATGRPQYTVPLPYACSVTDLPSTLPHTARAMARTLSSPAAPSLRLGEPVGGGAITTAPARDERAKLARHRQRQLRHVGGKHERAIAHPARQHESSAAHLHLSEQHFGVHPIVVVAAPGTPGFTGFQYGTAFGAPSP